MGPCVPQKHDLHFGSADSDDDDDVGGAASTSSCTPILAFLPPFFAIPPFGLEAVATEPISHSIFSFSDKNCVTATSATAITTSKEQTWVIADFVFRFLVIPFEKANTRQRPNAAIAMIVKISCVFIFLYIKIFKKFYI
jgi:hypothetical protein